MLFQKKPPAPPLPSVTVVGRDGVLYEGLLKEIPLKEHIIIEKSIRFFNDPEPCFIHRGAVRVRLTEELYQELQSASGEEPGSLMKAYADLPDILECRLK